MSIKYENQLFGTRLIIKDFCSDEDWIKYGVKKPKCTSNWVLGKCTNCGCIKPVDLNILKRFPPKRCSFCSGISHNSTIDTNRNHYVVYDDYAIIQIMFNNQIYNCYIDVDCVEICEMYKWRLSKKRNKFYVVSGEAKSHTQLYLHHLINGFPEKGLETDHIDGNSLNNRKSNLRFLSRSDNARRVSERIDSHIGIRGVTMDSSSKLFAVDFTYNKNRFYFKRFKTIGEAVWCRYFAENYFGIDTIIKNPLFEQYNNIDDKLKNDIENYVLSIIEK